MLSPLRRKPQGERPYDLVVVGGGVAGLYAALAASARGASVLLLSKGPLRSSNSYAAQGGIAAAVGAGDDPALHAEDTLAAGRGLCRPSAVRLLTEDAPARIADLAALGVEFDAGLAREGGHSRRRVVHAGGAQTGSCIADALALAVRGGAARRRRRGRGGDRAPSRRRPLRRRRHRRPRGAGARDAARHRRLRRPLGADDEPARRGRRRPAARVREPARRSPTSSSCSSIPPRWSSNGFLLSEALRGDGALLLDEQGERFTDELAPRDVVARAIAARDGAGLDLRPVELERYPSLVATLERAGYDPADEPIPVAPAAHYSIGGIVTDLDGRSTVPGLYAAGECACTGVHGANRLASNSLLECVVFGRRAGLAALGEPAPPAAEAEIVLAEAAPPGDDVRRALWREAGLIRNADGLERLLDAPHPLARLIARSALARTRKPRRPLPRGLPGRGRRRGPRRPAARRGAGG